MRVPCLVSERILLRPYREEDFKSFAALNATHLVRRHIGTGEVLTQEAARVLFDTFAEDKCSPGNEVWCAVLKDSSEYVGHLFLVARAPNSDPELGFLLEPRLWGQGLATEAAETILRYAFAERQYRQVIATVDCDHVRAIRILEKLGMKCEERQRDETGDYLLYSIRASI